MPTRTLQLVLHYDGTSFSGWQRQPDRRTVQGVLEETLARLCAGPITALGSGRTDAGVHARGQAVGVRVPERWTSTAMRRALNAVLPHDIWVAHAHDMREDFHARYSASSRRYSYYIGTEESVASPFRRTTEWALLKPFSRDALDAAAAKIVGEHCFRAFAVRGTAPVDDTHRCRIAAAEWRDRHGGLVFEIEANRFLHHMVRFLVGTMADVATGRRALSDLDALLMADTNDDVSAPAPAHALFLDVVRYPDELYTAVPT
ncbi:MAG: tRNA pseudouridine(38-40) synthase TruA [Gemmatimonadota bacterium]|nr:tRNA pseudouridine(38-40) synthase TruA [Gemmatimonadota bacterium]